jgi:hypothetical protein
MKNLLIGILGVAAVGGSFFVGNLVSGGKGGDGAVTEVGAVEGFGLTVDVTAAGKGTLALEFGALFEGNVVVDGSTSEHFTVAIPSGIAKKYVSEDGSVKAIHIGGVKGEGNVEGEIKATLTTPFGQLPIYDNKFQFPKE